MIYILLSHLWPSVDLILTSNFYLFICLVDSIHLSKKVTKDAPYLMFTGSLDLLNVACSSCDWNKENNTLSHLKECQNYTITAKFNKDCERDFSIYVPVSGNYNSLKQNPHYCS